MLRRGRRRLAVLAAASLIAASAPPQQALADTPATQDGSGQIVFCDTPGLRPGTACVESIAHEFRVHTDRWEHRISDQLNAYWSPWAFYDTTTCRMLHTHCGAPPRGEWSPF